MRGLLVSLLLAAPCSAAERSSIYDSVSYRRREIPDPRVEAELKRLFPGARPEGDAPAADGLLESPLDPELDLDRTLRVRFARDPKLAGWEDSFDLEVSGRPPTARIVYRESAGAFRAFSALAGLASKGRARWGSVKGRPAFRWRGTLEGFYGRPWGWQERREFVAWMGRERMNLFVLAPKDEDALRRSWRRPFSAEELARLKELKAAADESFVELAVSLSPLGAKAQDPVDAEAAARKLEQLLGAGVRRLVLAFDDMDPDPGHEAFAAKVVSTVLAKHPEADFTVVPAQYWSDAAPSRYLKKMSALEERVRFGWTGPQVISRRIRASDAARFAGGRRRLALGDNYPVQDRIASAGRLFLGPVIGRDPGLAEADEVWLSNASPLIEASKIPLATAADFAWDPARYDPAASWERSVAAAGGPRGTRWLKLLARECASSWLTVPDGWRPAGGLRDRLGDWEAGRGSAGLRSLLTELAALPDGLSTLARPLARELAPWAGRLGIQAEAGLTALALLEGRFPPERRAAALTELKRLRLRAEAEPALAADLALDRFLRGAEEKLAGGAGEPSAPPAEVVFGYAAGSVRAEVFEAALARLWSGPAALTAASGGQAWAEEAVPWPGTLAACAARAQEAPARAAEPWAKVPRSEEAGALLWRWRARARFLPLWAAKRMMEDFFAQSEAAWSGRKGPSSRALAALRTALKVGGRFKPDSLPVLLARHLEAYDAGDAAGLETMFTLLAELPARVRLVGGMPEEAGPWLDKVGQYGRLGLLATALRRRAALKKLSKEDLELWASARGALRSSNGLELALELKLALDSYSKWAATPKGRRPPVPDLTLPSDPSEL